MRGGGLRLSLAVHFFIFVTIAMVFLNVVSMAVWQQHIERLIVKMAKQVTAEQAALFASQCNLLAGDAGRQVGTSLFVMKNGAFSPSVATSQGFDGVSVSLALKLSSSSRQTVVKRADKYESFFGGGYRSLIVARPVEKCGMNTSIAAVVNLSEQRRAILQKQPVIFFYILINGLIITTLWFFRARKKIMSPLEELVELAGKYHESSSDILKYSNPKSEFTYVSRALHTMLVQIEEDKKKLTESIRSLEHANTRILENQRTLVEAEKFAAVGRMSAGIAHEIGNPIGIIQGYVELLRHTDLSEEERMQFADRAEKELQRVSGLIRQLLDYSRKNDSSGEPADIGNVLSSVVEMLQDQNAEHIVFTVNLAEDVNKVTCRKSDLQQVVLNCLLNSIDAITSGDMTAGNITIIVKTVIIAAKIYCQLTIEDNGIGLEAGESKYVFDPFYTTKEVGKGTGLGLSVSRTIIENSGGSMYFDGDNNGACVTILLPVAEE